MKVPPISIAIVISELLKFLFKLHQSDDQSGIIALAGRASVRTRTRSYEALTDCKSRFPALLLLGYRQYCPTRSLESASFAGATILVSERPSAKFSWRKCLLKPPMYTVSVPKFGKPCGPYSSTNTSYIFSPALSWQLARTRQQNKRQFRSPASTAAVSACSAYTASPSSEIDSGQSSIGNKGARIVMALVKLPLLLLVTCHGSSGVYAREALTSSILATARHLSNTRAGQVPFPLHRGV